ncbi:MAG: SAM-dependent methyltransferase [Acidobacteria bacterium]|nr:SAM-dependent methyltransferase [Acidobacteriota bacterium]
MDTDCRALIVERVRQRGPLTVAAYMDLALYAPGIGYYARAVQRSGRTGDFFTSVDVGPLFGTLLASHFAELWSTARLGADRTPPQVDLVEVAAGNGRLSRDVLDAAARRHQGFYESMALHLIERSDAARAAHGSTLGPHVNKLATSSAELPPRVEGILFANELLDALPVHLVQMTASGLAEVYVDVDGDHVVERLGPPSTPALAAYLEAAGIVLDTGTRGEINLNAVAWITDVARRLTRGYLLLIDYGYEAAELYSAAHPTGTLSTFHRHVVDARTQPGRAARPWLEEPGTRDLTSHVDLTSVRVAAEHAGLTTVRIVDQTRFLLGIVERSGLVPELSSPDRLQERLALKTLLIPGGLGSTHKVLVFAKGID